MPPNPDVLGLSGQLVDAHLRVDALVEYDGPSAVYEGHHLSLDAPVRIKFIRLPPTARSQGTLHGLVDRLRAASAQTAHLWQGNSDVARILSAGLAMSPRTGEPLPYAASERFDGQLLTDAITGRRAAGGLEASLQEVIDLLTPAALALAYAHSRHVVHGDLQPRRLFLARGARGQRLKVLDLGIPTALSDDALGLRRVLVSPCYAAPEQFAPELGPVGPWTDVYAFGLLTLEAIGGRVVRPAQSFEEGARVALDPRVVLNAHALGIKVPSMVELLLAKAVAYDKSIRPQHLGELWAELNKLIALRAQKTGAPAASQRFADALAEGSLDKTELAGAKHGPATPLQGTVVMGANVAAAARPPEQASGFAEKVSSAPPPAPFMDAGPRPPPMAPPPALASAVAPAVEAVGDARGASLPVPPSSDPQMRIVLIAIAVLATLILLSVLALVAYVVFRRMTP